MVYTCTIEMYRERQEELQSLLDRTNIDFHEEKIAEDSIIDCFTAEFKNKYQADIKVCSGTENCFIDPVLFDENGNELCCLDCEDELIGTYKFSYDNDIYVVNIEVEENKVFKEYNKISEEYMNRFTCAGGAELNESIVSIFEALLEKGKLNTTILDMYKMLKEQWKGIDQEE